MDRPMDPRLRELIILALVAALACGMAWVQDYTWIGGLLAALSATAALGAIRHAGWL